MGQAKVKLMEASIKTTIDLNKISFHIGKGDFAGFSKEDDGSQSPGKVNVRVTRFTLFSIIGTIFKDGMDRHDRRNWSAWQECFDDNDTNEFEVTIAMIRWVRDKISKDDLKISPGLSQWVEAIIDYFDEVIETAQVDRNAN